LHLRSHVFTLTKLAGLFQIPFEKHNYFIGVIGATEDLSPFGTSGLAVGAVCIEDCLPSAIVRDGIFDNDVRYRPASVLVCRCGPVQRTYAIDRTTAIAGASWEESSCWEARGHREYTG
jgi:hypothetical protein